MTNSVHFGKLPNIEAGEVPPIPSRRIMELTKQQQGQKTTEDYLDHGGKLTDPDSIIEQFNAIELAQIIELEMAKAMARGNPLGITVKMNMVDAQALARFLRRGSLLGA